MPKRDARDFRSSPVRVAALVYDNLCTFEYGIVCEVFGLPRPELGGDLYHLSTVAVESGPIRVVGGILVEASGTQEDLLKADLIVVPGWKGKDEPVPEVLCQIISSAHARGARLLSICSGSYVLAASGVLDGKRATTHWQYAQHFSEKFPKVSVETNDLYVDEGNIITSAGSSAGIDACLHVVRKDYGSKVANSVARRLVMHAHRQGGQAQFIEQPVPKDTNKHSLSMLMDRLRENLSDLHDIETMARVAQMSSRTFQRKFLALTGTPAKQWLIQERVARSCSLLETTKLALETISYEVGFPNAEAMRYHFKQSLGVTPKEYRRVFSAKYNNVYV